MLWLYTTDKSVSCCDTFIDESLEDILSVGECLFKHVPGFL